MTDIDIAALAALARLEVAPEELEKLETELPDILAFVETIKTAAGSETKGVVGTVNTVMREDEHPYETGSNTETLLKAAPATRNGYVVVKQVVSRAKAGH